MFATHQEYLSRPRRQRVERPPDKKAVVPLQGLVVEESRVILEMAGDLAFYDIRPAGGAENVDRLVAGGLQQVGLEVFDIRQPVASSGRTIVVCLMVTQVMQLKLF